MQALNMSRELSSLGKQPLKRIEAHLHKFNEVAIPYHVDILKKHKNNIIKFQGNCDWNKVYHEQINATRSIKQLRAILSELDVLRSQVQDCDLIKFDKITSSARESALEAVDDFLATKNPEVLLERAAIDNVNGDGQEDCPNCDEELRSKEINLQLAVSGKINREKCLRSWENLEEEVQEIHELFQEFAKVVSEQKEKVDDVHDNVEEARESIAQGARTLRHVSKLKASIYPVAGALVGGCLGGPVGLVAGFKLGGLAAVGCGILGFTGGRLLKKKQEEMNAQEVEMTVVNNQVPESKSL